MGLYDGGALPQLGCLVFHRMTPFVANSVFASRLKCAVAAGRTELENPVP